MLDMNLLQAPAETFNYMVMGYAFILGMLSLYLISIVIRFRNLKREIVSLGEIEFEEGDSV
jgi:hypothetical protein